MEGRTRKNCGTCDGSGTVGSGGLDQQDRPVDLPCPECRETDRYRPALERIADAPTRIEPDADVLIAHACVALGRPLDWLDGLARKWYEEGQP